MMLQYSEVQPMFITSSEDDPANDVGLDVTTIFQKTNKEICDTPDSSSNISKSSSSSTALCNNIYVCTFCQVFSPIFNIVSEHISSSHSDSLPPEASPSSFVSKLQALNANAGKKKGKVGRPKKNREISLESPVPKQLPSEPIPRPDGLFWCKKCLRNFRKPRQLMQHICLDLEEQDSDFNDSPVPSEDEFRTWVDVDPVPWSRMERRTNSRLMLSMDTSLEKMDCISDIQRREVSENKVVPNWREDPTYIPLFCNENEKSAFEKHLKSIDYTCVDALFEKEEKSCRSSKKGNCVSLLDVMYSCYICKKVLKSLSHIRLHCLTHTDLKPFTCPKCTYRTNSKGSLYIHMRKHTGNMFCCSFCDFQCVKRSHLLEHEATHSSVTQFCKLCKNSYKTFKSLIAHIKKYHNNPGGKKYIKSLTGKLAKEFKCSICNKKFKSSEILEKHSHVCHDSDLISVGKVINLEENLIDKNIKNLNNVIQNSECLGNAMLNSTNLSCITQNSENLNSIIQNPENLDSVVHNPENVDSIIQNPENVDNVVQINKPDDFEQLIENVECNVTLSKDPSVEMVLSNFQQQDQSHSVIHNSECLDSIVQNSENLDCIMQNTKNLGNVMQINKSSSLEQLIENVKCNVVLSKDPLVEMVLNNFQQHSQSQSVLQNPENLDSAMQINKPSSLEQLIENVKCNVVLSKDPLVEMVLNNFLQQGQSHSVLHNSECLDSIIQNSKNLDCIMQNSKNLESVMQINEPSSLEQLNENVKCNVVLSKDPLVEMVLNNFLQQGQSQCTPSSSNLLENFPARRMSRLSSESSILEECQKTLDFELLSECLQSTDFSNECNQDFGLQSNNCSLQSNSKSTAENSGHLQQISANKSEESKPVEIKLFEKCRRAPAYVCCVCSSIYICSSTLKAHLKEHVNITSSTLMDQPEEQFEPSRMIETTNALENVCEMLEASSAESCSIDEELEKLYTSSLDKMWYLPGLSVVLQHDPALFDPALDDDISNFSMTDKYDASQDLCAKGEDENVLKCFDEI